MTHTILIRVSVLILRSELFECSDAVRSRSLFLYVHFTITRLSPDPSPKLSMCLAVNLDLVKSRVNSIRAATRSGPQAMLPKLLQKVKPNQSHVLPRAATPAFQHRFCIDLSEAHPRAGRREPTRFGRQKQGPSFRCKSVI